MNQGIKLTLSKKKAKHRGYQQHPNSVTTNRIVLKILKVNIKKKKK